MMEVNVPSRCVHIARMLTPRCQPSQSIKFIPIRAKGPSKGLKFPSNQSTAERMPAYFWLPVPAPLIELGQSRSQIVIMSPRHVAVRSGTIQPPADSRQQEQQIHKII